MGTNPNPIENNFPAVPQGLTEEELKQFGVIATIPEEKPEVKPALTADELAALNQQFLKDQQLQNSHLLQQILTQRQIQSPPEEPKQTVPQYIPVEFDKDNKPFIRSEHVAQVSKPVIDEYHKAVVAPHEQTVQHVERQMQLNRAADLIRSQAPELLEGKDQNKVANMALGLYMSPEIQAIPDEVGRHNRVMSELKSLNLAPSNPTIRPALPANQVGNTALPENTKLPYPKGTVIDLPRLTISEMGLEKFNESIEQEARLHALNEAYGMNWTINVKRPAGM